MKSLLLFFVVLALLAFAFASPRKGCCGWAEDYSYEDIKNKTETGLLTYKDLVKRGEAGGEWWWWTPKKQYVPGKPDN